MNYFMFFIYFLLACIAAIRIALIRIFLKCT